MKEKKWKVAGKEFETKEEVEAYLDKLIAEIIQLKIQVKEKEEEFHEIVQAYFLERGELIEAFKEREG